MNALLQFVRFVLYVYFHSRNFKEGQSNIFKVSLETGREGNEKIAYIEYCKSFCCSITKEWFSLTLSCKKSSDWWDLLVGTHTTKNVACRGGACVGWVCCSAPQAIPSWLDLLLTTTYHCSFTGVITNCHVNNFWEKSFFLKVKFGLKNDKCPWKLI